MSPGDYGKKYWHVELVNGNEYVFADRVFVKDGALVLDAFEGDTQRHATIFAPGRWIAVHGASVLDGSHVAVETFVPSKKRVKP